MAENANELIQGIVKQLTSACKEQTFSFDQPLEYTAENIVRLNTEAMRQVENLIYSRDVIVDTSLKIIYLGDNVPLEVLTLLPLKYPEMDPTPQYRHIPYSSVSCPPKIKEVECSSYMVKQNGEILGHVSYHGPGDSDPEKGIIAVGHKTHLNPEKPVSYTSIDIEVSIPEDKNE